MQSEVREQPRRIKNGRVRPESANGNQEQPGAVRNSEGMLTTFSTGV